MFLSATVAHSAPSVQQVNFQDSVMRIQIEDKKISVFFRLHAAKYRLDQTMVSGKEMNKLMRSHFEGKTLNISADPFELKIIGVEVIENEVH
jgi:hypothetical protein